MSSYLFAGRGLLSLHKGVDQALLQTFVCRWGNGVSGSWTGHSTVYKWSWLLLGRLFHMCYLVPCALLPERWVSGASE